MAKRLVQLKEVEVYKDDARSRVWRVVDDAYGDWVVKRFEYWTVRQVLGWMVGVHPGQFELRRNRKLQRLGVPVVAIEDWGMEFKGGQGRFWLATKYEGVSLHHRIKAGGFVNDEQRQRVMQAVGGIFARLVELGIYFRDFKASNVLVSDDGQVRLIDVGSARRFRWRRREIRRTAALLDMTLEVAGATEAERAMVRKIGHGG